MKANIVQVFEWDSSEEGTSVYFVTIDQQEQQMHPLLQAT